MKNSTARFSRLAVLALMGVSILALEACSTMRSLAGVDKSSPDEFRVVNKPPLTMPPDYNLLPPRAGEPAPQQLPPAAQAIGALFPGRTTLPPPASVGETALIETVGAEGFSGNIRNLVGDSETLVVEKGVLLQDVLSLGEREGAPDGSDIEHTGSEPIVDNDEGGGGR
jgi:Protein of unknown function (DUF3035)